MPINKQNTGIGNNNSSTNSSLHTTPGSNTTVPGNQTITSSISGQNNSTILFTISGIDPIPTVTGLPEPTATIAGNTMTTLGTHENKEYSILALGDSYTIGESVPASQRYPVQLVDSLNKLNYNFKTPKIIARTGWTTNELKTAIKADGDTSKYDFVFLLIGVNNQYRGYSIVDYRSEFKELLSTALGFAGNKKSHVIVVSIPDYGYTPFGNSNKTSISSGIDQFNAVNKEETQLAGVIYVNITNISRSSESGLVAGDGLHPSGKQYKLWAGLILPEIIKNIP